MSGRRAKRLRREAHERGDLPKRKHFFKPLTVMIEGKEVFIPRRQRRAIMRKFMTDIRKGRIDLAQLNAERIKRNNDRKKLGQGI